MENSSSSMHFLDVKLYKKSNRLETDVYRKPTDSMSYVPYKSCHPRHILRNIPFSLACRLKKIVSEKEILPLRLEELKQKLIRLDYPKKLIDGSIEKALKTSDDNSTVSCKPSNEKKIRFMSTYNPNNPKSFHKVVQSSFQSLKMLPPFNSYQIQATYKQPQSLLSLLRPNKNDEIKGVRKCNENKCGTCHYIIEGKTFHFRNRTFNIKHNMNCYSHNVIYVLRCLGCMELYIGQTGDLLKNRMTVHRHHIKHPDAAPLPVSRHISRCAADKDKQFEVMPFFQLSWNTTKHMREIKESCFISQFKPSLNSV